ncbi:ubiquitin carboxyl-terminal hydrolase 36 isoform X3 [Aphis craccivora]|uniref:Ubiquitin carboxyl-terminal hydrolase 36 n=1 Tax=Aphis craccivora TaxID=307492 RepID=A0A6G0YAJ7_APHCR|nr:ubiquitin carboxyl-terminal hydrolase 36 isoform X3 [Aphis craccivora]
MTIRGVPSLAPFAGNITAEKHVWCTQRKSGFVGEKDTDLHDRSIQVTTGELVGYPKSTSGDRGDTGVASQASVPFTTGAETAVSQMDTQPSIVGGSSEQPLSSTMENLDTDIVPRLPKPRVVLYPLERVQLGWQDKQMAVGSGLALFHILVFANWLLNDATTSKKVSTKNILPAEFSKDCIVCMVRETFKLIQKQTGCSFKASLITNRLSLICKYLSLHRQEDAHEFLCYLMESMERCYLSVLGNSAKSLDDYSIETTPIHQIFSGYIRTEITCGDKCGYVSTTYQNFKDMILDIRESENINDALEKFFVTESLDGFTCEGCQRQGAADKMFAIEKAPNRYNYDMSGRQTKNCKPIKINRKIYLKLKDQPPLRYRLVSMVNHHGRTLDSGHYTTFGLTPYGYYCFNDSNVYQTNFKEHSKSTNSYIIFYELKPFENKTNKPPADDKPRANDIHVAKEE